MLTPANDNPARLPALNTLALAVGATAGKWRVLAAVLLGVSLTLAMPPLFLMPFLPVAFCGLYWLQVSARNVRRAMLDGWWFGMGYFVPGLYWISNSLMVEPEKFGWILPFALLGIPAVYALFPAAAMGGFFYFRHLGGMRGIWMFALLWLAAEWLRGHILWGFPWILSGYAWSFSETTIQFYAFFGVYLTGFLTVLLALLPAARTGGGKATLRLCLLSVALFCAALGAGYARVENAARGFVPDVMLRIVQPAIAQRLKWDPQYQMEGLQKLATLTLSAGREEITHVIWPESAMPYPFASGDGWAMRLAELVPPDGLLMTGVMRMTGSPEDKNLKIYNSVQAVDAKGEVAMVYDKAKLVPFGEFVPLRSVLPMDKITHGTLDFSSGEGGKNYSLPGLPSVRPLICYESIFPALAEDAWPAWLLNVTNDAWFGDSSGPRQHLEMARARAVEQGVPLVRAANTGISAVVDAYGRVIKLLPLGTTGVIDAPLPTPARQPTVFSWAGYYYTILIGLTTLGIIFFQRKPDKINLPS